MESPKKKGINIMVLKSYRLKLKNKKKRKPIKDLVTGGVTAIIGIGLLSETARAVSRV